MPFSKSHSLGFFSYFRWLSSSSFLFILPSFLNNSPSPFFVDSPGCFCSLVSQFTLCPVLSAFRQKESTLFIWVLLLHLCVWERPSTLSFSVKPQCVDRQIVEYRQSASLCTYCSLLRTLTQGGSSSPVSAPNEILKRLPCFVRQQQALLPMLSPCEHSGTDHIRVWQATRSPN